MATNAIGFVRISKNGMGKKSTKEIATIRRYCKENRINLLGISIDAKRGDEALTEIELLIRNQGVKVKYLVIADYDGFSRNIVKSISIIKALKAVFDIEVLICKAGLDVGIDHSESLRRMLFEYLRPPMKDRRRSGARK